MLAVIKDATFISKSMNEFTDKSSGELKVFYKGLFAQDESSPLEISISEDVFTRLEKFKTYDLSLEVSSFNRKFYVTVVDAVPSTDSDFLSGELDIA